jgi:hypothetical protein
MYTCDLNNAYTYESERRRDEMANAANCRLASNCDGAKKKMPGFSAYIPGLLLALMAFFIKR